MRSTYPLIICGAGPTGLMLAAQLLRFGVHFLIIDKKAAPTTESRAIVVQARSMELYEQLGLSDEIVATGEKMFGICFWRNGRNVSAAQFKNFGTSITPFDFVMMYEQSENESLLYRHLQNGGREVSWQTELISYTEYTDGYGVTLSIAGSECVVNAQYLIACDGAGSRLRELSNMNFVGGTYEHVFYVADTFVSAPVCKNRLNFFLANKSFHLLFPMKGDQRYRAIGILPPAFYHQPHISFEDVSRQVEKDISLALRFHHTQWYSTYRLHHKKVTAFRKGNLFFCGDAAHVHSPAGGQGMNTGLQDACNLAWKLGMVIQYGANKMLLATYHEERNPVAERLLKTTDRLFAIVSKNTVANRLIRLYLLPFVAPALMKLQWVRRRLFRLVSQTEIHYSASSLSKGKAGSIKAGMRLPYVQLFIQQRQHSLFQLVRLHADKPFLLMLFRVSADTVESHPWYECWSIEDNPYNSTALQKAGFSSTFVLLLRPDLYIGWIAETMQPAALKAYLQTLIPERS